MIPPIYSLATDPIKTHEKGSAVKSDQELEYQKVATFIRNDRILYHLLKYLYHQSHGLFHALCKNGKKSSFASCYDVLNQHNAKAITACL